MEPVICANKLVKTYRSGASSVKALDGISLEIAAGEFLMITGKNGSGKSTLLHQLALLDNWDSGEITINGQKTAHLPEKKRQDFRLKELGYIFQEYALISELTALENVMLPAMMLDTSKKAKNKALEILAKVDLANKCNRLPSELSGGEQQKVAIARSLINSPKIIFADEPTANLDSTASKSVLKIFKTLNEAGDITIVMVTHEPEELSYSTRRIELKDGRIV